MYESAILKNRYLLKENVLSNVIEHIDVSVNKLRNGKTHKIGIDDSRKIFKDIVQYSQPLKQAFGDEGYRKVIKTLAIMTNIKSYNISNRKVSNENFRMYFEDDDKNFLDKIKEKVYYISNKISDVLVSASNKLKNHNDENVHMYKSSLENYLDRFFNKLDQNNLIVKHKKIITNIMFIIAIGFGAAIMNIGVKMSGSNLNQVKSFGDFIKMIASSMVKNPMSFILITVGLIIFLYSLYVIMRKTIIFVLDKLSLLLRRNIS